MPRRLSTSRKWKKRNKQAIDFHRPQIESGLDTQIYNPFGKGPVIMRFITALIASFLLSTQASANKNTKIDQERFTKEVTQYCEKHFPGLIQSEVRAACISSAEDHQRLGRNLVETRCRLNYGDEPRLVMACLIGASIGHDLSEGREDFKSKLQLCAEAYPVHNEIDAFLQESCITGTHVPELMSVENKARHEACAKITPERSFIGPCAVGLGLVLEDKQSSVPPIEQNKHCEQYFNLKRFHKGYRACMNARGLTLRSTKNVNEVLKDCGNILSDRNNETEKAACLVGLTIHRKLSSREDITKHFQKCGDNKVTYQDRDFLACLTAASLLYFTNNKTTAQNACREIYKNAKSRSRGDCLNSLNLF